MSSLINRTKIGDYVYKLITEVKPGDTIIEGPNRTEVKKVEVAPPGCRNKVHINERECWERYTEVRVQDTKAEIEETAA